MHVVNIAWYALLISLFKDVIKDKVCIGAGEMCSFVLFLRALVQFAASTWELTTVFNSDSRGSDACSGHHRHTCK